jgi:hypothetical protein
MLNTLSNTETAADVPAGFGTGACLRAGVGTVAAGSTGAVMFARPRAAWADDLLGQGIAIAPHEPPAQPIVRKQYLHTTPFAAASGGALGSHPARDPV